MTQAGKLIVIEGIDGVGKGTQAALLLARVREAGVRAELLAFPRYGTPGARQVEEYLNGAFGDPDTVSPYDASRFFAADRHAAAPAMREQLEGGTTLICDRYVDSNAGHQGGKIEDPKARERFLEWLYELEYETNGAPKPDVVVILYAHADIGQQLVGKKDRREYLAQGTHDGHEGNLDHLRRASDSFLWLAKRDPGRYRLINCSPEGEMLSIEEIHNMIWRQVSPVLGTLETE